MHFLHLEKIEGIMNEYFGFVLYLSSFLSIRAQTDELIVTIEQGKLQGFVAKSRNGTVYRAFTSIPYAKPPIGELRFQSPQKADGWEGVRNATNPSPFCVQQMIIPLSNSSTYKGQEDCLYLNIFASIKVSPSSKLPVLIFIHGGAFATGGSTLYFPDYFMDHNVIIVTLNYRLGSLGFLSTGDSVMPGNYGMKDQAAAFKWVKENIAAFGGNPELVTIFGSSSGGACVHLHLYSPLSAGLFQRAISQGGSAFSLMARATRATIHQKTLVFGSLVGCPGTESSVILRECLKTVPVQEIVFASQKFLVWSDEPSNRFAVVPESKCVADGFIYEDPLIRPPLSKVPWIAGMNSAAGALMTARYVQKSGILLNQLNDKYKRILPIMLNFVDWLDYYESERTVTAAKKFYFGDHAISLATIKKLTDLFTDIFYLYPLFEGMSQYQSSVYFYYYDHRGAASYSDPFTKSVGIDLGVADPDEIISLMFMPQPLFETYVEKGPDLNVSKRMIERWITFARTGNPSIGGNAWEPFQSNEVNYLHITTTKDEMKKGLLTDRLLFWKNTVKLPGCSNKLQSTRIGICLPLLLLFYFLVS